MNLQCKNVYLSAPMTGIPDFNRDALRKAESRAYKDGAEYVYNPAGNINYFMNESHERAMIHSLRTLTAMGKITAMGFYASRPYFDAILMLPGWQDSAGARVEHDVAVACGIESFEVDDTQERINEDALE